MTATLSVVLVSKQKPVLVALRKLCQHSHPDVDVRNVPSLPEAIEFVRDVHEKAIVYAHGLRRHEEVVALRQECRTQNAVLIAALPSARPGNWPSSGLLEPGSYTEIGAAEAEPLTGLPIGLECALRKALRRQRCAQSIRVRPLETIDFDSYFKLRYEVWKELKYLAPKRDPGEKIGWELDYTDRSAIPIGAFLRDNNQLIGCARLVQVPRKENLIFDARLQTMIQEKKNKTLCICFDRPERLDHPFDVLKSFEGFRDVYAHWRKKRVSRAEVSRVIVSKEMRKRGYGEVLVDSLVSLARSKRIKKLFLACREQDVPLYSRCSFELMPGLRCDSFYGVGVPAVAMAHNLDYPPSSVLVST